jgi:argininosuccinate lyase
VAAPGAGKMLELISATIEYVYGSAAFTIGTAGNMTISYKSDGSGSAASGTLACTGFFDQTSTTVATVEGVAVAAVAATAAVNQALALIAATADMTVGTGATGVVKLAYRVHSGL